ncbi:MAG TPA: acyltransferase [Aeromicrobium sp.]|nr:acyltransferase [Aeromicrobium sp.]
MVVRRIAVIDGLRGVAAFMVMGLHWWYGAGQPMLDPFIGPALTMLVAAGYAGVDLFFVISGFVLFLPVCERRGDFGSRRTYTLRRAARILPLYWVTLAVVVALVVAVKFTPAAQGSLGLNLLLHLGFLQHTVSPALGLPEGFGVNGVIWTLSVEVTFYLLLPFIARRFYNRPALWFALFLVVSASWRLVVTQWIGGADTTPQLLPLVLITQLPTYLPHFGLGMVAAWIWARRAEAPSLPQRRLAMIGFAGGALVIGWSLHELGVGDWMKTAGIYTHHTGTLVVTTAFAVLLLSALMAPRWLQRPFDNAVARKLGEISYGLYLWHAIVIWMALTVVHLPVHGALNASIYLTVVLFGTIGLAWLSHVTIERPAIEWARRKTTPAIADVVH